MDTAKLTLIVKAIVSEQQTIIGPMAIDEANKVSGLKISVDMRDVTVSGEAKIVLQNLVGQYQKLFGQASVEACKESIKQILPQIPRQEIPEFLVQ
ncbi:hypothetical protein HYS82_00725 [Candidatus Amesbacteria bacterium]|nr:hypothetical protein [Candidatus Amesbacteria bacterium]